MTLPLAGRLAWRELRNHPGFCLIFALNLGLGLLGFVLLDSFKAAFNQSLDERSRTLLGADLAISARRELTEGELAAARAVIGRAAGTGFRESRTVELYSMI